MMVLQRSSAARVDATSRDSLEAALSSIPELVPIGTAPSPGQEVNIDSTPDGAYSLESAWREKPHGCQETLPQAPKTSICRRWRPPSGKATLLSEIRDPWLIQSCVTYHNVRHPFQTCLSAALVV
jgi:hypothetical protein